MHIRLQKNNESASTLYMLLLEYAWQPVNSLPTQQFQIPFRRSNEYAFLWAHNHKHTPLQTCAATNTTGWSSWRSSQHGVGTWSPPGGRAQLHDATPQLLCTLPERAHSCLCCLPWCCKSHVGNDLWTRSRSYTKARLFMTRSENNVVQLPRKGCSSNA